VGESEGACPLGEILGSAEAIRAGISWYTPERGQNVWRGGSFNNNRRNARSSYRNNNQPDEQNDNLGFRLAGDVEQA
jgi:formylglycine-generating enzyme required for sulfatase activity